MLNDQIVEQLIEPRGKYLAIKLFIQAKAKKNKIIGIYDGRLKLAIAAPPLEGRANREVQSFLASCLGLKKKEVTIVSGERSRRKTCALEGIEREALVEILQQI